MQQQITGQEMSGTTELFTEDMEGMVEEEMMTASSEERSDEIRVSATRTETSPSATQPDIWGTAPSNIHWTSRTNHPTGNGGGGGGGGGGGLPDPDTGLPPAGGGGGHGIDKLFGQPPDMFIGDCAKTKEFLTQWELYFNLNHLTAVMGAPYSRCMLFLMYLKGPLTATCAVTMSCNLPNHVQNGGILLQDKRSGPT